MFQRIEIIGNLGGNPEMKFTPSGQAVTAFSVAASNQYKGKDGNTVKETTWFRVEVWGAMAEACNTYLTKGAKVFVAGRLKADKETGNPRIWQKKDGTSAASFEVIASEVKFLSTKETGTQSQSQSQHEDAEYPF